MPQPHKYCDDCLLTDKLWYNEAVKDMINKWFESLFEIEKEGFIHDESVSKH